MALKIAHSVDMIVKEVEKFFDAVDTLKLNDVTVNDLIVKRQEDADKDEDLIEQVIVKLLIHEQIAREMEEHGS